MLLSFNVNFKNHLIWSHQRIIWSNDIITPIDWGDDYSYLVIDIIIIIECLNEAKRKKKLD